MLVRETLSWTRVISNLGRPLGASLATALAVAAIHTAPRARGIALPMAPFTVVGAALSIFLAFRNNAAYDRYWEGRKLWGAIVNASRTFARQALTLVAPPPPADGAATEGVAPVPAEVRDARRALVYRAIAFAHALRCHLRGEEPRTAVTGLLPAAELEAMRDARNVPAAVAHGLGVAVADARRRGWLDAESLRALDATITELTNAQGGCERIKNTPIPRAYTFFTRRIVEVYALALPLGLVEPLGWATPLVALPVAFVFLLLERIGRLLEQPFGTAVNDLPLSAISTTIEIDLRQRLGERDVPAPVAAVDGVLS